MAWRSAPVDMAYDDDELIDRQMPEYEPPSHPPGLIFCVREEDLEKAGCCDGDPGDVMRFSAMGAVTSVVLGPKGSRIELELNEFAGDDGKFFDLEVPAHISLSRAELDKMDLDEDCDVGDTIHLIGEARLETVMRTDGMNLATLQVTALTYEDESAESRER